MSTLLNNVNQNIIQMDNYYRVTRKEREKAHVNTNTSATTSPSITPKLSICEQYSGATISSTKIDIPTADTITINTHDAVKVPLLA